MEYSWVQAATIGIRTLADLSVLLKDHQQGPNSAEALLTAIHVALIDIYV
jgi:hypothetical protein